MSISFFSFTILLNPFWYILLCCRLWSMNSCMSTLSFGLRITIYIFLSLFLWNLWLPIFHCCHDICLMFYVSTQQEELHLIVFWFSVHDMKPSLCMVLSNRIVKNYPKKVHLFKTFSYQTTFLIFFSEHCKWFFSIQFKSCLENLFLDILSFYMVANSHSFDFVKRII